mgnify:CR=1 FL=1
MHLSSLISALYERSATFKDLVKRAGGAKAWCASFSPALTSSHTPLHHHAIAVLISIQR